MQKIRVPLRKRGPVALCVQLPTKFTQERGFSHHDYVVMTIQDDGSILLEPKKIAELERMAECA
jgi:hypothetical protein